MTTKSNFLPVTVSQLAQQVGLGEGHGSDSHLEQLIRFAVVEIENKCYRAIGRQTIEIINNSQAIDLPRPPFVELVSVETKEETRDSFVETTKYELDSDVSPAVVSMTDAGIHRIKFITGEDSSSETEQDAVMQLATYKYNFRGDHAVKHQMPLALKSLIDQLKVGTMSGYFR